MKRGNSGQVLVLVALAILVLLGFAALGIDAGYMYSVRHELQRSADAGALAGASAMRQSGKDCNDTTNISDFGGRTTKQEAELRATDYATRDDVATSRLNTVAGDIVTATCPDPVTNNPMRVRVDVQRTAPLFFARVLGRPTQVIPAIAVAEAFPVSEKVECVVPWGIPVPWTDTTNPGQYDPGDTVHWPPVEGECDGMDVTEWSYLTHDNGARQVRDQHLCQGSLQVLKIGDPHDPLLQNPGNFFGLDLSSVVESCPEGVNINSGASFYSYLIKHSCSCEMAINDGDTLPLDTEPGNMVNKTIDPVAPDPYWRPDRYIPHNPDDDSLMNSDPTARWDTSSNMPVSDAFPGVNWSKSPRVVRIPVYHPDASYNGGLNTPSAGKSNYQPLGFIGFWIQDVQYSPPNNGTIVGRFVTVEGYGSGSGGGSGTSGSPVLNIRLVE
jgi:hypothetical protein